MVNLRDGHLNLAQNGHYNFAVTIVTSHNKDYVKYSKFNINNHIVKTRRPPLVLKPTAVA